MRARGYSLDLYCDNNQIVSGCVSDAAGHSYSEFPHQYFADTEGECNKMARDEGWKLGKVDLCPKCSGKQMGLAK